MFIIITRVIIFNCYAVDGSSEEKRVYINDPCKGMLEKFENSKNIFEQFYVDIFEQITLTGK